MFIHEILPAGAPLLPATDTALMRNCWPKLCFFRRRGLFDAFFDRVCICRLFSSLPKLVYTLRTAPKNLDLLWKLLIPFATSAAIRSPFVTAQNIAMSGIFRDTRWLFNVRYIFVVVVETDTSAQSVVNKQFFIDGLPTHNTGRQHQANFHPRAG